MFPLIVLLFYVGSVFGYFTLPGNCPEKVILQEDFRLAQFYGKWYQVYHYSSDELNVNNCATVEVLDKHDGRFVNFTRLDADLIQKFSMGKVKTPIDLEDAANLSVTFNFEGVPKKLRMRYYPFRILATSSGYFSTVYTCSYSPIINKHFIYVWILSKIPLLNDGYKDLAVRPLNQIGVASARLVRDDWSSCKPSRYNSAPVEPVTFRFPVMTHIRLTEYDSPDSRKDT